MENQFILESLIYQRDVLFSIRKKYGFSRIDLEKLAFSTVQTFFTLYDLQTHYSHCNVQQIIRSIKRLANNGYIKLLVKGARNKPAHYSISIAGKLALRDYEDITKRCFKKVNTVENKGLKVSKIVENNSVSTINMRFVSNRNIRFSKD